MNIKTLIFCLTAFLFNVIFLDVSASQATTEQDTINLFIGSGNNQILVTGLNSFDTQNITLNAISSSTDLLEIVEVDYTSGYPFANILVNEKGEPGNVTVKTVVHSENSEDTLLTVVNIISYNNPGMIFEIHDIIFWEEDVPINGSSVFDTIIQTSEGPYKYLNYDDIALTVNEGCSGGVCTGHDFYTSLYKGYFIPPVDGAYSFYMKSENDHTLWLSPNEYYSNAKLIAARTDNWGDVGTEMGSGMTKSEPQELVAGKVYAFYATQWIIHSTYGGVLFEGPGISMDYIPGEYTMPYYDILKPTEPENLSVQWKTASEMLINWQKSTDDGTLSGYNLYLNGSRINTATIKDVSYLVTGLVEETDYYLAVTAVDNVGNESFLSNVLEVKTQKEDTTPPTPPQAMEVESATGLALKIKWSGAEDSETEVIGYYVYVDGELYNTNEFVTNDEIVILGLSPLTTYTITIEAVDGGMNVSEKSQEFTATTAEFDPLGERLGEKAGRVVVYNKNTSWNQGIGLNGPYEDGSMVNNSQIQQLVRDFKAGAIRWGAISANSKSFEGSVGSDKANTYAKMLNLANEMGAYFSLTVGVQDGIDYRTNPSTFTNLLEYLAGDSNTTWGAVRASEGFTEPLLQNGKGILLEFGNEVWGGATHDAEIGSDYTEYREWVREMAEVVKASPYYDPDKIIMVYSGRNPSTSSTSDINYTVLTGDRGEVDCLAVSGYLGGNLDYDPDIPTGDSELEYYKNGIDYMRDYLNGFLGTIEYMLSLTGTVKTFYQYESNMTTSSYNGRFGQAIIMTDYLAASMNYGSIVPSIFHLTGGQWRITRASENYKELPFFVTGKYFNTFCKGNILKTELLTNDKLTNTYDQEISFDPVGTYAYNEGESFSILLVNRDFENDYTMQLELPEDLNFADSAMVYTLWNDDFSSYDTEIDSSKLSLSGERLINLPKHSMVIVSIKGDDPEYEQLPLGYFARQRPDSLSVTSSRNFLIDTNKGTDIIKAEVFPEDAFSTAAVLDIIENTTESILTTLSGSRLHIKGSGKCGDEGYIKIHAYASDNHDLSDTVIVTIINQGTDCPSTGITEWDLAEGPLFYPNPTNDVVYFNKSIDGESLLQVYNSAGKIVISQLLNSTSEMSIGNFASGVYYVTIKTPDGNYFSGKLQKY